LARADTFVCSTVVKPGEQSRDFFKTSNRVWASGRVNRFPIEDRVDDLEDRLGGLIIEELPVDHHHGGEVTGGVAFDALQRDLAVFGGFVVPNPELLRD